MHLKYNHVRLRRVTEENMRLAVWTTFLAFMCYLAMDAVSGRRNKNVPKSLSPMVRNCFFKIYMCASLREIRTSLAFKNLRCIRNSLYTVKSMRTVLQNIKINDSYDITTLNHVYRLFLLFKCL